MIESLTLTMDLNSLPERTLQKLRKEALKRGCGIGAVAKELLVDSTDRVLESDADGTRVVEGREPAGAH